ncbi:MAG: Uncharacterised protein [Flavobacterium sp. SCGC AAA160-P02]|nr:MAG: Uncharacterised protein [Flavobacterium sp. SCGC AAA160-P02]
MTFFVLSIHIMIREISTFAKPTETRLYSCKIQKNVEVY